MRSSSDKSGRQWPIDHSQTKNEERHSGDCANVLYIVGLGPGDTAYMSVRAHEVLQKAEVVVGYTAYIELIRPLIEGKTIISTAMKKEVDRCQGALDAALAGKVCAIVSSGDPGIYAMAGLVFEMCEKQGIPITSNRNCMPADGPVDHLKESLAIEVIPGIPALCSGASLLGAPLTHDFAVISLSDLLTPWEVIEKRIEAAAEGDFVVVIFNPKSLKRHWQLGRAQKVLLEHRDPKTKVGIVTRAMRDAQRVEIVTLERLDKAEVNMQSVVFVGNSTTLIYNDFMITPRGYAGKYGMRGGAY